MTCPLRLDDEHTVRPHGHMVDVHEVVPSGKRHGVLDAPVRSQSAEGFGRPHLRFGTDPPGRRSVGRRDCNPRQARECGEYRPKEKRSEPGSRRPASQCILDGSDA